MYRKSCCTIPGIGIVVGDCGGISGCIRHRKMFKFYIKGFYVMSKALSGRLSCTGIGLVDYFFLKSKND